MTEVIILLPPLMPHQQQVHDFLVRTPFAGVWLDVGAGKTLTALTTLQTLRPAGHILVIAPVAIARSTWIDEIERHGFPIRTRSLIVDEHDRKLSRKARLQRFQEVFTDPPTMYFINQELLTQSPSRSCQSCHGKPPKDQPCQTCQGGLIDQLPLLTHPDGRITANWPFRTVIIDESQGFKSHASNRFAALSRMRPAITRMIQLTGTPAPNGLHDLWSQMYLLDQGAALGTTISTFRNRWFTPKLVPGTTIPQDWLPKPHAESEIYAAISHLVISAQNLTVKLPPLTIQPVSVSLTEDQLHQYRQFRKQLVLDLVTEHTDPITNELTTDLHTIVAENRAVLTSKLMQFASGTLYTSDPDDPSTAGQYEVIHTEKLAMAEYLIRNNGAEPVLLAYHFRSDKEQLLKHFAKVGIDARAFDGSRQMVQDWNAKRIPVMLLHPAAAGHGLNLQHGGATLIWYTLPFSLEHYLQANGRLFRTGQTRPVTIYQLITRDTQDERMPALLSDKRNTQQRLIDSVTMPLSEAASTAASSFQAASLAALEDELVDELTLYHRSRCRNSSDIATGNHARC